MREFRIKLHYAVEETNEIISLTSDWVESKEPLFSMVEDMAFTNEWGEFSHYEIEKKDKLE